SGVCVPFREGARPVRADINRIVGAAIEGQRRALQDNVAIAVVPVAKLVIHPEKVSETGAEVPTEPYIGAGYAIAFAVRRKKYRAILQVEPGWRNHRCAVILSQCDIAGIHDRYAGGSCANVELGGVTSFA